MYFTTILLTAITAMTSLAAVIPPTVPCTPSGNAKTCILTWTTNSGSPTDIVHPIPHYGTAVVYSPTCTTWGQGTTSLGRPKANLFAWGLSIDHPLQFEMYVEQGETFGSPRFYYGGQMYRYQRDGVGSTCSCSGSGDSVLRIDNCSCQFPCTPFSGN